MKKIVKMRENMPYEIIISDTSALNSLTDIGKLDLLNKLYRNITVITPEIKREYEIFDNRILPNWVKVKEVKNKEKKGFKNYVVYRYQRMNLV